MVREPSCYYENFNSTSFLFYLSLLHDLPLCFLFCEIIFRICNMRRLKYDPLVVLLYFRSAYYLMKHWSYALLNPTRKPIYFLSDICVIAMEPMPWRHYHNIGLYSGSHLKNSCHRLAFHLKTWFF